MTRLRVPVRDGVSLCTDVFLPGDARPAPTVLIRTPYGRHIPLLRALGIRLADRGLGVAIQDCRGRYQSGGRFDLALEHLDGFDTLAWLREQPWADGRVALLGISVGSHAAFRIALETPPAGTQVVTVINVMGLVDLHALFYASGALRLHWALPWFSLMRPANMGRSGWRDVSWNDRYRRLPLVDAFKDVCGEFDDLWPFVVTHPAYGPEWHQWNLLDRLAGADLPVLHVSGWHDFMLDQVVRAFRALNRSAGAASRQRLIVGPWNHQTIFEAFGPARSDGDDAANLTDVIAAWCARSLASASRAAEGSSDPRVRVNVLGTREWIAADDLKPATGTVEAWYLASDGHANASTGDGRLAPEPTPALGHDSFMFDPEDPAPTTGGAIWPFPSADLVPGPADQSAVERRADVLVYTSAPIAADLTLFGDARVELWAATSALDTDFTAKLVDVDTAAVPHIVQDGIVRARFREGADAQRLLEPQHAVAFAIDMGPIAYRVAEGHRLRLEISSSNFPKYDRNMNTGAAPHTAAAGVVAVQTVFHGRPMSSRLLLTVAPAGPRRDARTLSMYEALTFERDAPSRPAAS